MPKSPKPKRKLNYQSKRNAKRKKKNKGNDLEEDDDRKKIKENL